MKRMLMLMFLGAVLVGRSFAAGPFGFEKGMTAEQLTKLLGQNTLKPIPGNPGAWKATTAPKPHPAFEEYLLIISPKDGLLKVVAVGKDIQTGDSGAELQSAYADIVAGVTGKYGQPRDKLDGCNGGTGCDTSQMWMLSLLEKNRYLMTTWSPNTISNVHTIGVEAVALKLNEGYVSCAFEFDGFHEYVEAQKEKQNDSF
jgi:hypothetical protein